MDKNNMQHILVAMPERWNDFNTSLCELIKNKGCKTSLVMTLDEAFQETERNDFDGIIVCGEWAFIERGGNCLGLTKAGDRKFPTIFLVSREEFELFFDWYNKRYSPIEDYLQLPVDVDQLVNMMKKVSILSD